MTLILKVEVIVAPSEQVSPQIIRRKIATSFSSTPQHDPPEKTSLKALPKNSPDFDRKIDLNLGTDIIVEEPRNFEQLMLKSLGLDWNVDDDKLDSGENTKKSWSEHPKRKSGKNGKREIKEGGRHKIIADKTKVKDDSVIAAAAAADDNGDYQVRGNPGDDSLAEESKRTNVKEELFSQESGSKESESGRKESKPGRTNLKEQLFSSLLNLKESVVELKKGISVAKEKKEMKEMKEVRENEREMDYGLWQPFYNEDVDTEVRKEMHV